ncbi:MAG: MBOAT family protein [Sphingobacteriales bacterium]|nr:MAG: MBOAT family protein [Sphingobacteriales bacterium]
MIIAVILNLLVLCIFKYYNFFIDEIGTVLSGIGYQTYHLPHLDILLPIGLSFHTFQALSYLIEVKRGNITAERHFGIYALYVMFFPQLVAGPIERPQNMLHQFHEKQVFDGERVIIGLKIMLWGFVKKLVIADRLGLYVDEVYRNADKMGSLNLWLAVLIFFPFQVYCDFSGYSSIALGSAKVMGYNLMENFRTPFASLTTSELWNRWHISLSSWFRDYVYQPIVIALRDYGKWSVVAGLLTAFFLSGLWHGAGLSFICYGLFQGIIMISEFLLGVKSSKRRKEPFGKLKGIMITYFLFSISLVFFRALGLHKVYLILEKMFWANDLTFVKIPKLAPFTYVVSIISILCLILVESFDKEQLLYKNCGLRKDLVICTVMISVLLSFGVFYNVSFIYFQF